MVTFQIPNVQGHTGLTPPFSFFDIRSLALRTERQSALMSKN